jgi:hypothetical protein
MADKIHGVVAVFETSGDIFHAAEKVRDAGFKNWDVITPFPIHGMDAAMGLGRSLVPIFAFIGGTIGFFGGMAMIAFMNWLDYPLVVYGRPFFSPISSFPVSYELTILLAAFGSIIGMFVLNKLPMHYHPVLKWDKMHCATDDKFLLIIESTDPKFDLKKTKEMLAELGSKEIEELED